MEGRRQMAQRLSIDSALANIKKIPQGFPRFAEASQRVIPQNEAATTLATAAQ
jgi:hypothetical protein